MTQYGKSSPLTVTFDTNTLSAVVLQKAAHPGMSESATIVREAIQNGLVCGFFSETLITLEGVNNHDRAGILGKTRVASSSSTTGPNRISITVGVSHTRPPLDSKFAARVYAALQLGMQPLRAPARIGDYHVSCDEYQFFEPVGGQPEFFRCMDKVNSLTTEIAGRGVGNAVAIELGLQYSKRDNVNQPELFLQGLGRARNKTEQKKVAAVVREWADGDSIAAHYGFGIQLFCSDDFGKSGRGASVLDTNNRKWLTTEFGVEFVKLSALAELIAK